MYLVHWEYVVHTFVLLPKTYLTTEYKICYNYLTLYIVNCRSDSHIPGGVDLRADPVYYLLHYHYSVLIVEEQISFDQR